MTETVVAERKTKVQPRAVTWRRAARRSPVWRLVKRTAFYLLVALIFVYALFPFFWVIRSAFTPESDLFITPIKWFPAHPTLQNFRYVFETKDFQEALVNSAIVAGSVTLIALALGAFASYALGRIKFRGRTLMMYLMLSMTIFPQIAILGALYTMVNNFHFYNSLKALILTYMILVIPLTVWVLTSFMRALPRDLEEAAYIDGASPFQTFWRVVLPLVAPALVTTGMLAFIASWNEFLFALSFTETPDKHTVPVAITSFTTGRGGTFQYPWGEVMAATLIVTVPLIALTLILQRRIVAGLTAGAVKG